MTQFWAKTPKDGPISWDRVQTVMDHMVDTGLTFEILTSEIWPALRTYLSSAFPDLDQGHRTLCVIAGVHDIGKISRGFQSKVPELCSVLREAGFTLEPILETAHGINTMDFLLRHLESIFEPEDEESAGAFAQAASCHHGQYVNIPDLYEQVPDTQRWEDERIAHLDEICRLWELDGGRLAMPTGRLPAQWTVLLAGCICIADWIASSLTFPHRSTSRSEYMASRCLQVRTRLREAGFEPPRPSPEMPSFHQLFGPTGDADEWKPNDTQCALYEMTSHIDGPFLAIVESPTGIGKTEAALLTYARTARQRTRGLFFALPTMATTNAMFGRVEDFLGRLFEGDGTQITLMQSEALLHDEYARLLHSGRNGPSETDRTEAVRADEWFVGGKRGLLSEHAVGTVDQIMLAAMSARHHFVRYLGLVDKMIVIDEVHAYDVYMLSIIESLLAWLRAIECPVILLSATLPSPMRRSLLAAYANTEHAGSGHTTDGPRISVWSEDGLSTRAIDVSVRNVRMTVKELSDSTSDTFVNRAASEVLEAVDRGGCIACIVNTVHEAQQVFEKIDTVLDHGIPRMLLHARFIRKDRADREATVQRLFGRDGHDRPERAVVVSTQILEQSLDVDFDLMISDLAPVDLLIQRLGRVHRHLVPRPSAARAHPWPTIVVLSPPISDFRPRSNVTGVYQPIVLARTAVALAHRQNDGGRLVIPGDDSLLLEAVYGDNPASQQDLSEQFDRWEQETAGKEAADRFSAAKISLGRPDRHGSDLFELAGRLRDLDEWSPSTRLGSESRTVVLDLDGHDQEPRRLIDMSVRVNNASIVRELSRREPPEEWKEHWYLRRCVRLDMHDGVCRCGGYEMRYSDTLGLVITKEE